MRIGRELFLMNRQFTLRNVLAVTGVCCVYFALAHRYGFGRAIICLLVVVQAVSSVVFFYAGYQSWRDEHPRNALAACILGILIVSGSVLLAVLVFQPIPEPFDPFSNP